jgi:hypothetical protein
MLTDAKFAANQANAQHSTGPRTSEGKAAVSQNSATFGLFAARDLVRPEDQSEYDELRAGLEAELCPATTMERTHAMEILHASWRLRRCAVVEAGLLESTLQSGLDPMESSADSAVTQAAIDRARAHARNNLRRASEDLSRLQTERRLRAELETPDCRRLQNRRSRQPPEHDQNPRSRRPSPPLPPQTRGHRHLRIPPPPRPRAKKHAHYKANPRISRKPAIRPLHIPPQLTRRHAM